MPIINKYSRPIMVALLVVVVVLAALLVMKSGGNAPSATPSANAPASPAASTTTAPAAKPAPANPTAPAAHPASGGTASAAKIHILTPVAGDVWTITKQNLISWDKQAGVSGQIELLNAATLKLVGVILNETGPLQTSYAWNTRDLLLGRTNPAKITVVPGSYVVRIAFDGNNLSPVTSPTITLVGASQ